MRTLRCLCSAIDAVQNPMLEPADLRIVLFLIDVRVSLAEILDGFHKLAATLPHIAGWMIVDILPIIDRSPFELVYRMSNLSECRIFVAVHPAISRLGVTEIPARRAQISQRVQVRRMSSRYPLSASVEYAAAEQATGDYDAD